VARSHDIKASYRKQPDIFRIDWGGGGGIARWKNSVGVFQAFIPEEAVLAKYEKLLGDGQEHNLQAA